MSCKMLAVNQVQQAAELKGRHPPTYLPGPQERPVAIKLAHDKVRPSLDLGYAIEASAAVASEEKHSFGIRRHSIREVEVIGRSRLPIAGKRKVKNF